MCKCFDLALEARSLDMRASPYDVTTFGLEPVYIERPDGSLEYQRLQKGIADKGRALAQCLIDELGSLLMPKAAL